MAERGGERGGFRRGLSERVGGGGRGGDHAAWSHVVVDVRKRRNGQLKIEVNRLVKEGFFQDCLSMDSMLHVQQGHDKNQDQSLLPYIKKIVNVISEVSDLSGNSIRASLAHACRIHSIKAMTVIDNEGPDVQILFNQGEAFELEHPHDNALITLDVAHVHMKQMLVDTGSSANILLVAVLKGMEIEDLKA
uniref:Uncharacterized protein n=1 Tax=Cannabis sativa TaxID=3483 RepID=A0A803Q2L8_CANSA